MSDKPIIEIKKLSKTYKGADEPAVNSLSLDIFPNEIFGLLGPNGAGKTTTISILCGLFPASDGTIIINGFNLSSDLEKIKQLIGVVPQEIALYPTLTAKENLTFYGNMYGIRGKELKDRIGGFLKDFGLEKFANRQVGKYSGGMKRRVNLIAGLLHRPKVIFLDEPTVGIDVQSRIMILNYLQELNNSGITIIYTSHYMEEAEQLCTRVAIMDLGKIVAIGKPSDLLASNPEFKNLENVFIHLTGKEVRD
jgi:ABC-2 type transport system ATP-binding protein